MGSDSEASSCEHNAWYSPLLNKVDTPVLLIIGVTPWVLAITGAFRILPGPIRHIGGIASAATITLGILQLMCCNSNPQKDFETCMGFNPLSGISSSEASSIKKQCDAHSDFKNFCKAAGGSYSSDVCEMSDQEMTLGEYCAMCPDKCSSGSD
jgi:hypothetical protein